MKLLQREIELEVEDASLPRALPPVAAAALVFVAAGAVLMLEILAVRLLAPYVGLTLEATTAIIGAALAGIAAGAALGGFLADRTDTRRLVVLLLVLGGILALLLVPLVRWLGPGARGEGDFVTLAIAFAALVPPAAVLSAVSPAIAHLQLHDLHHSGTVVGSLSAWATAGALVGTFGTGFVLIPIMSVSAAVLGIGVVLVLVGLVLGLASRLLPVAAAAGAIVIAVAVGAASAAFDSPCEVETRYHCAYVEADPENPKGYNLLLDDGYHSYVDLGDHSHLVYPYSQWMGEAIDANYPAKEPLRMVVVGGGGFTLPLWLQATRPGSTSEVLEVDGELVDFVEEKFEFQRSDDLRVEIGDARLTMRDLPADSADVIVGDAYASDAVPWHLVTTEWMEEVQRVLKPDGIYMQNILDFDPLKLAKAEAATLLDVFPDVRLVTFRRPDGSLEGGSVVLFASDRPIDEVLGPEPTRFGEYIPVAFDQGQVQSFAGDAEVLRDDYAPADQLLTPE